LGHSVDSLYSLNCVGLSLTKFDSKTIICYSRDSSNANKQ